MHKTKQQILPLLVLILSGWNTIFAATSGLLTSPPDTLLSPPCTVLIGVHTYIDCDGEPGAFVSGIVEGSIAETYGLQPDDIIIGMDNKVINTPNELVEARNTYKSGDSFVLQYIRRGRLFSNRMQFPYCHKDKSPSFLIHTVPNPTPGLLRVSFHADPVATTIHITDISGQVVYNQELRQFHGNFNEAIDLSAYAQGVYILTITQEMVVMTKKIVLIPLN